MEAREWLKRIIDAEKLTVHYLLHNQYMAPPRESEVEFLIGVGCVKFLFDCNDRVLVARKVKNYDGGAGSKIKKLENFGFNCGEIRALMMRFAGNFLNEIGAYSDLDYREIRYHKWEGRLYQGLLNYLDEQVLERKKQIVCAGVV